MAMLGKFKNTHAYRTLKEYSECATVHGISYIFEKVEHELDIFLTTVIYSFIVCWGVAPRGPSAVDTGGGAGAGGLGVAQQRGLRLLRGQQGGHHSPQVRQD